MGEMLETIVPYIGFSAESMVVETRNDCSTDVTGRAVEDEGDEGVEGETDIL